MNRLTVIAKKRRTLTTEVAYTYTRKLQSKDSDSLVQELKRIKKELRLDTYEEEYLNERLGKWTLNSKQNCNITIQR